MKDVIDVLELQGQREKHRKFIDYRHHDGSYMGVRFIFECGSFLSQILIYIFRKLFKI